MLDTIYMGNGAFQVNCLIAGTQKGGTTALTEFLRPHSEICFPPRKEAHFFDDFNDSKYHEALPDETINKLYWESFPNYNNEPVVIDATPFYMYYPHVARRVHRYNPDMKWIILLRDPAQRALSHYQMERTRNHEYLSAWQAFILESTRIKPTPGDYHAGMRSYSYLDRGKYSRQLANILEYFPIDQILVIRSKMLWNKHEQTLMQIYAFIGISPPDKLPVRKRTFNNTEKLSYSRWLLPFLKLYFVPEYFRLWFLLRKLQLR